MMSFFIPLCTVPKLEVRVTNCQYPGYKIKKGVDPQAKVVGYLIKKGNNIIGDDQKEKALYTQIARYCEAERVDNQLKEIAKEEINFIHKLESAYKNYIKISESVIRLGSSLLGSLVTQNYTSTASHLVSIGTDTIKNEVSNTLESILIKNMSRLTSPKEIQRYSLQALEEVAEQYLKKGEENYKNVIKLASMPKRSLLQAKELFVSYEKGYINTRIGSEMLTTLAEEKSNFVKIIYEISKNFTFSATGLNKFQLDKLVDGITNSKSCKKILVGADKAAKKAQREMTSLEDNWSPKINGGTTDKFLRYLQTHKSELKSLDF